MWKYVIIFLLVACSLYTKEQFCHSPSKGEILTPTLAPPLMGKHHPQRESVQLAENEYVLLDGRNGFPEILVDSGQRPLVMFDNKDRQFPKIQSDTVLMNMPGYTALANGRDFVPSIAEYETIERDTQRIRQEADLTRLALEWLDPDQWNKDYNLYDSQLLLTVAEVNFFGLLDRLGFVALRENGTYAISAKTGGIRSLFLDVPRDYLVRVIGENSVRALENRGRTQLVQKLEYVIGNEVPNDTSEFLVKNIGFQKAVDEKIRKLDELLNSENAEWLQITPAIRLWDFVHNNAILIISGDSGTWIMKETTKANRYYVYYLPDFRFGETQSPQAMSLDDFVEYLNQSGNDAYMLTAKVTHLRPQGNTKEGLPLLSEKEYVGYPSKYQPNRDYFPEIYVDTGERVNMTKYISDDPIEGRRLKGIATGKEEVIADEDLGLAVMEGLRETINQEGNLSKVSLDWMHRHRYFSKEWVIAAEVNLFGVPGFHAVVGIVEDGNFFIMDFKYTSQLVVISREYLIRTIGEKNVRELEMQSVRVKSRMQEKNQRNTDKNL